MMYSSSWAHELSDVISELAVFGGFADMLFVYAKFRKRLQCDSTTLIDMDDAVTKNSLFSGESASHWRLAGNNTAGGC